MFNHLPTVSEGSYQVFVDRELEEVFKEVDKYNEELWQKNSYLARAVHGGAVTVSEDFGGEDKRLIEGYAVAVQLAALRLIDRALEAQRMETKIVSLKEG